MKKIIIAVSFSFLPILIFAQEKIAGQFFQETVLETLNQQIGQREAGSTVEVVKSYLIVQGKKYHLYRFSKDEIEKMKKKDTQVQQTQPSLMVVTAAYYLLGNKQENGKFCQIKGIVNKEENIIYSAALIEVFDENKITGALNKCNQ